MPAVSFVLTKQSETEAKSRFQRRVRDGTRLLQASFQKWRRVRQLFSSLIILYFAEQLGNYEHILENNAVLKTTSIGQSPPYFPGSSQIQDLISTHCSHLSLDAVAT